MKPIQRTDSLNHATKLADGTDVVYASSAGGMRKVRCPRCTAAFAAPATTARGKNVLRCASCGAEFTSTQM